MLILRVGDPHTQINNLSDSEKLIDFIIKTAKEREVGVIEFLGDLFNNHAIKRVEVENFWLRSLRKITENSIVSRILVGNHDMVGNKENEQIMNSLNVFDCFDELIVKTNIINRPMKLDNIGYIPYTSDKDLVIKWSRDLFNLGATKTLIAHQTFTGARYDNGFYSPEEGIDPDLILQESIVSGHIHLSQQIGKCFYPGSSMWQTASDANQKKGIWLYDHNTDGSIISKEFIGTENVVTPIFKFVINEGDLEPELNKNARNHLEFHGKSEWITKMKKKYKGRASIKVVPEDRRISPNAITSSISLQQFLASQFEPILGVSKQEISEYLKGLYGTEKK